MSASVCSLCGGPEDARVTGCVAWPGITVADVTAELVFDGHLEHLDDPIPYCPACGAEAAEQHHPACEHARCRVHRARPNLCSCVPDWAAEQARGSRPSWWRRLLSRGADDLGEVIR